MILLGAKYDANDWEMAMKRAMDVDASDEYAITPDYTVPARWEFAAGRWNSQEQGRTRVRLNSSAQAPVPQTAVTAASHSRQE